MNRYVTAPHHIAACDLGPDIATVLVNYQTGTVHTLIGPSARWWTELAATADVSTTTSLSPPAATRLSAQLRSAGLLVNSDAPRPWAPPARARPWRLSFGTHELQAGVAPIPHAPVSTLVGAWLATTVALAALHLGDRRTGMGRIIRLLTWAASRPRPAATAEEAERAVHAVRQVGRLMPGRMACLEESAAVVLLLSVLTRRQVTWCHGVAPDPIKLHAWVETDQGPVAEPGSTARYTAIRTITSKTRGDHD